MVIAKSKLFNVEEKKSFPAELKKTNLTLILAARAGNKLPNL
jgi:hypothetical protein